MIPNSPQVLKYPREQSLLPDSGTALVQVSTKKTKVGCFCSFNQNSTYQLHTHTP